MIPGTTKDYYSVPLENSKTPNCSHIFRNPLALDKLFDSKTDHHVRTAWDIFQKGKSKNPDADFLGTRKILPDGKLSSFEFISYAQAEKYSKSFGSALLHYNWIDEQPSGFPDLLPIRPVGIYLANSVEWLITELACDGYGFTLVPLYDTLGRESILHILKVTEITTIVSSFKLALNLLNYIGDHPSREDISLTNFILIDNDPIPMELLNNKLSINIKLWSDVIRTGEEFSVPFTPATPEHVHTISFTSGTSGIPNAVVISHRSFTNTIHAPFMQFEKMNEKQVIYDFLQVHLSYLPLAHMFERCYSNATMYASGKIGFFSGEIKTILDDFQTLKPTCFVTVPRLLQRIYDRIISSVQGKNAFLRALFNHGLSVKLNRIKNTGVCEHNFYDKIIFGKLKELLGGEIKWIFTGSAPLDPYVHNCLRAFFSSSIVSGYGLTECCAGALLQRKGDPQPNNVGGPLITLEYKIESVPDLQLDATGDRPRGQLLLRGSSISSGYFKNPKTTGEVFKDGWLHTGDVVERLENGSLVIIDRLKEIFKLTQGEYISPERIETLISRSPFIIQSFVTGKSTELYPVAIIVPDPEYAKTWANKNNAESDIVLLCNNAAFKIAILDDIKNISKEAQLKGFEFIKQIHLEPEQFTTENGLITTTAKLRRNFARRKYNSIIENLYKLSTS